MNHSLRKFGVFILILTLISCKKDYSLEDSPNKKCVNCIYLPVCDSSVFVYTDSTATSVDTLTNLMSIYGDTIVNGQTFTSVSGFATFNTGLLANCDNQDYKLLFPVAALGLNTDSLIAALLTQIPVPIPPSLINFPETIQTSILKANQPVNATWSDNIYSLSLPPLLTFNVGLDYTIIGKDLQRSIYAVNYSNVIHVRSELVVNSSLINLPLDYTIDYFFAKDVGIIEVHVTEGSVVQRILKLYSYQL